MKQFSLLIACIVIILSCSTPFIKYEKADQLALDVDIPVVVKDFNENATSGTASTQAVVQPTPLPTTNLQVTTGKTEVRPKIPIKTKKKGKQTSTGSGKNDIAAPAAPPIVAVTPRQPELESSVGFPPGSRRPSRDPFRVGEKTTLMVSYFKAKAGELSLEVRPFVEVNGKKSYRWVTALKTLGVFSNFYSVDDVSETMVDFDTLVPSVFTLNVRETAQLKQAKGYFDTETLKAKYYEKKYTEKKGQEEKRQEWTMLPFSQNVFSAAFYMRLFTYEVGREYVFNVADDEKNILFKAKCLRKERIETDAGVFDTVVIQPQFEINGVFKPSGDIFFWLTDDDRKFLVRIESDIKIGTIVADALSVDRGAE